MSALSIWMNGERVGVWERSRTGRDVFTYDLSWVNSPQYRPISLSLPVTADLKITGDVVGNYFDNLLPDTLEIRNRLRKRFSIADKDAFSLLSAIGRDCVGAVQILPVDATSDEIHHASERILSEEDVASHLSGLGVVFGDQNEADFRISIAGAQEKTALLYFNGSWFMPEGVRPTTHILKPQIGLIPGSNLDLTKSVQNEWICNKLLKAMGFSVANTSIEQFGPHTVLSVERFDRYWGGDGEIYRLPQEDLCQALGFPSSKKYESDGGKLSGPGMEDCLSILRRGKNPVEDCSTFLKAQLAFWLLAAIDGHSKNFSISIGRGGEYNLTPLYDVISVWPNIGHGHGKIELQKASMAMGVPTSSGRQRKINLIQTRHWKAVADSLKIQGLWEDMVEMVENLEFSISAVSEILPENVPKDFAEEIFAGARNYARKFLRGLEILQ
ncbi:MAG: type II toxin-antitoxin system HipA family toxin [Delftia acidovorans]|nr:type II toxin-antitoxin system HipA family toxin [Delftia acidovorans]